MKYKKLIFIIKQRDFDSNYYYYYYHHIVIYDTQFVLLSFFDIYNFLKSLILEQKNSAHIQFNVKIKTPKW